MNDKANLAAMLREATATGSSESASGHIRFLMATPKRTLEEIHTEDHTVDSDEMGCELCQSAAERQWEATHGIDA